MFIGPHLNVRCLRLRELMLYYLTIRLEMQSSIFGPCSLFVLVLPMKDDLNAKHLTFMIFPKIIPSPTKKQQKQKDSRHSGI